MQKYYIASLSNLQHTFKKITLVVVLFFAGKAASFSQAFHPLNIPAVSTPKGPFLESSDADLDLLPPVITYTNLGDTCYTGNRILIATITDADGVPVSGSGLPVLYWQINSAAFTPVQGVSLGSNQYRFTFGTGVSPGTLVSYYIVAQDNLGNVVAKPSAGAGGYTTSPPAASTPPSAPSFYVIQTTLAAGSYNVGVGQTYVTLTDAINAYNNSCLGGAITFVLTDATYDVAEIFPLTISNPGASSINTLTIKPNTGLNTIIQGTAADAIIKLNGADYITIDGSNSGGTTRNLTINNSSTNTLSTVIWVGSSTASNGATHNTIKNCNINGNGTNTTYAAVLSSSGVTPGQTAEAANLSNSYINNSITTSYYGMVVIGPVAGETGTVISNNIIGSTSATKKLGYRGLVISNQTGVQVNNNSIIGVVSSIGLGSDMEPTGGIIVSGAISGGNIFSNNINDIRNTNLSGWPAYGISLQSSTAAAGIKIYDNFIHTVVAYGNATTPGSNGDGIAVLGGGGYGIYFNSVHLYANQTSTGGGLSAAIFIGPGATGTASLDIRDNIFSNRRTTGSNYAIYSSVPVIVISNINYNDYYASPGILGYLGSNRANIGAWQAATAMDGNSVSVNPIFVSQAPPVDLHLNPISPLNDQGITIAGITTDIDGITRSATPDIGADEFTPPNCTGNSGGTATADFITVCTSGSVILSATGFSYGLGIGYQWQSSTDGTNFINITGETNPTSSNPPIINVTTWYRLKVTCSLTGGSPGYSTSVMVTVYNPAILTKTNGSRCGPGTVNLAATGSPTTAIQWYTTLTGGAPVYTGSPFTTPSLSTTTTYYVESTYLGSSGTVGPASPTAAGGTISTQLTSWEVTFNVIQATKLLTVDVYPLAVGENSIIDIYNSAGTIIASVPYTTTVGGGATAQTITMNVSLTIGNGYYLYATAGLPPTGLTRNITGATYPYNSSDIQITGNGFDPNFYMCYYRWRFSNGCSSDPRSAVTATIGASTPVTISASPASVCAGECSTVTASSTNTAYIYTWTPGPQSGASITVCPTATTTYTYTAVDGACTSTGSVLVTVKPVPSNVVITPGPTVTKCASAPAILLTATGGDIAGVPVLTENFNGATTPAGWIVANTSTGSGIAASNWTLRPDGYTFAGTTFHSNDSTQFYLSNSDANTGTTRTTLRSPVFSLVGYSSATIKFWQYFAFFGAPDSIAVEISQDGTTWTPVATHTVYSSHLSKGVSTNFAVVNANMDAWAGLATNYVRFRYTGNDGFQWAIDNVTIAGGNGATPITWSPTTGLFTNSGASTPYTGTPATATVYAKPSVTTTYTATANPVNGCPKSDTIRVNLRGITGAISADISSVCPSQTVNISIALTGTGPWSLTYTPGILPAVTVNNILTSPYTFAVNPLITTTYTITALNDAFCSAAASDLSPASVTVTVSAVTNSTWLGITNDWLNPVNWCGGVPTSSKNVVIPSGPAFFPVITTTVPAAKDIAIGNGASITVNSAAMLSMTGNLTNNGTITINGTLTLNGTTVQSFPGTGTGLIAALNNLTINNPGGVTFNKSFTLTGTLKPVSGTVTLNNATGTLHSDLSGTARVDTLGATSGFAYVSGKFSIERYISSGSKKAWRFLAAPIQPLAGSQTINAAWQEGQIAPTYTANGYGMQIVGPSAAGAGFDINNIYPSVKKYDAVTNAWLSIPGTMGQISATDGYMCFIRGDRGANTFTSPLSPTTLRMSGQIKTGDVTVSTANANTNKYISVGNPYPSAIDFASANTIRTGLVDVYYLWDPKIGQYGGYQTFAGPGYIPPGGGPATSYNGNRFIESGQAFFIYSNSSVTAHSLIIKEKSKVASNVQVARIGGLPRSLTAKLYLVTDTTFSLYDGNRVDFSSSYSNEVDDNDAGKMVNFGENLSLLRNGQSLAVERHAEIIYTDTIFYQLSQLRQQQYQLSFLPEELSQTGLIAYLHDGYTGTNSVLSLENPTDILFTVDANTASSAADRFYIFFRELTPVPVTFTSIQAYPSGKDIEVAWHISQQLNIDHYDVEKSADGRNFLKIGTQQALSNSGASIAYKLLDEAPFRGDNFYRIVATRTGDDQLYSKIALVNLGEDDNSSISISPNPVINNIIGINFINELKGDYNIRLFSMGGQLVMNKTIHHPGGTERTELFGGTELSPGLYNLEILFPNKIKRRRTYKLLVE